MNGVTLTQLRDKLFQDKEFLMDNDRLLQAIEVQKDTTLERSIRAVIDTVYDSANVYQLENFTDKEVVDFIDSFSHSSLEKIEEYILSQPTLEHTIKFKCSNCGTENEEVLSGLESFF